MYSNIARFLAPLAAGLCLLLAACPGNQSGGSASTGSQKVTSEPGFSFKKTAVGLSSEALDFIGNSPQGLAGAKPVAFIYFAVANEDGTHLYVRELRSGKRRDLGSMSAISGGSLSASTNGRFVVYSRQRDLKSYIDDPTVTDPSLIATVIRRDQKSGKETDLFNFREAELRDYRADTITPFISSDGSQVVALAYNYDRLLLSRFLSDWVKYEQEYRSKRSTITKGIAQQYETNMRLLTQSGRIAPLLKELGVEPSIAGPVPEKERAAMAKLAGRFKPREIALLIWSDNKANVLKLKVPAGKDSNLFYIFGASKDHVLVGTKNLQDTAMAPQDIYSCDLKTGEMTPFLQFSGMPSTIEISGDGKDLLIVYNPFDPATKQLALESHLMRVPLSGGQSNDTKLPGDFFGFVDITSDGRYVAAQDRSDYGLYIVEIASQTKQLLAQMVGPVAGVFIEDQAKKLAYLDQGILFSLDVVPNPQQSKSWVEESYFEAYKQKLTSFLSSMKYVLPPDIQYRIEEYEGLGRHEVSAELRAPGKPDHSVLIRYDVKAEVVTSLWFPQGNPFSGGLVPAPKKLDYYGCEKVAKDALNAVGWLPGDTRQTYQPGPNPLYDGKTDSFIVVYRDGYWLGSGEKADWVTNKEATLRISASTGQVAEMTLLDLPEVKSQPRTITIERAKFLIRNEGTMKIPEKAPIRFDEKNVRLVVAPRDKKAEGPAEYTVSEEPRLCYEIDMYILPEDELIMTSRIDTETGELLGQLDFQPTNIAPVQPN